MKQKADLIGNNTAYCISDLLCFQKKTVPAYWTNTIPLWVRQEKLPSQFLILNLNLWNMTYAPLKIAFASIASKAGTLMSFQKCLFQRRKIIEASFSHCSHSYQFSNTPKRKCYKKLHNLFSLNQSEILLIFFFFKYPKVSWDFLQGRGTKKESMHFVFLAYTPRYNQRSDQNSTTSSCSTQPGWQSSISQRNRCMGRTNAALFPPRYSFTLQQIVVQRALKLKELPWYLQVLSRLMQTSSIQNILYVVWSATAFY